VDKKVDQHPFELALSRFLNVKFVDASLRHEISWGDHKMVQFIVNLIKMVDEHLQKGYYVLLSNNGYPFYDSHHLNNFGSRRFTNEFIERFKHVISK
jgi:hypothetical protein